ncbi:hypothetical protein D9758_015741 [Tetrapyrgos nigripes]|uniref:F-box domain-containing protein n=1 Tax=Tetrapyrgos nigripes TaxID=182062 RepID=A0A8H5CSI0_9AGAR|nr:hypothetical protein D9758_015741 [Tetrapyrgos nigripes]
MSIPIPISFSPRVVIHTEELSQKLRSPFGYHTWSNDILDSSILLDGENDLTNYDAHILVLEQALKATKEKRQQLQKYLAGCRSLTAPIRSLPQDVIELIFLFCCPEHLFDSSRRVWRLPGFVLSSVCHHWRNAALASSRLWSRINICASIPDTCSFRSSLELCLERSRAAPLYVQLELQSCEKTPNEAFISSIVQHSHRWRYLRITITGEPVFEPVQRIASFSAIREFPSLEEFTFNGEGALLSLITEGLTNAPRLRAWTMWLLDDRRLGEGCWPFPTNLFARASFNKITTLSIASMVIGDVISMLHTCPNVVRLTLGELDSSYAIPSPSGNGITLSACHVSSNPIILRSLKFLKFSFIVEYFSSVWKHWEPLLDLLTTPALNTMFLEGPKDNRVKPLGLVVPIPIPVDKIGGLITRSKCNIDSLGVRNMPFDDVTLITLLRLMPSISRLGLVQTSPLSSPFVSDALFAAMDSPSPNDPVLLPNLLSLKIKTRGQTFSPEKFVSMIDARRNSESASNNTEGSFFERLERVTLAVLENNGKVPAGYERLHLLRNNGLEVDVCFEGSP